MSNNITVGEQIFDITVHLNQMTEYGASMMAITMGQAAPPLGGARIDVAIEGVVRGSKLNGKISGTDYLSIRADGLSQVHIHAEIDNDDGAKIALFAQGVSIPIASKPGFFQEAYTVQLSSSDPRYAWLNQLPVWTQGFCSLGEKAISVKGYAPNG